MMIQNLILEGSMISKEQLRRPIKLFTLVSPQCQHLFQDWLIDFYIAEQQLR